MKLCSWINGSARAKGNFKNKAIVVQKANDFNDTKCYKEKA